MTDKMIQDFLNDLMMEQVCLESLQHQLALVHNTDNQAVEELEVCYGYSSSLT